MSASQPTNPAGKPGGSKLKNLLTRLRRLFALRKRSKKWAMVVVNPAAGQFSPDLKAFNRIIHGAGMDWEVEVTNAFGEGGKLAARAVAAGASVVAACGGDGTVRDVVSGLLGSPVPLAIIPSGTGNALAKDLGIPLDLNAACALMVNAQARRRPIDLGVAGDHLFLLRLGVGLEAEITRAADRSLKDRLGPLAYITATLQAWNSAPVSRYRLVMDDEIVETDGLACMVANAGSLGVPGLTISPRVRIDDGLLDVFVIRRADLSELGALAASVAGASPEASGLPHWQTSAIRIEASPPHGVEADGDELGTTPLQVEAIARAVQVIVPG